MPLDKITNLMTPPEHACYKAADGSLCALRRLPDSKFECVCAAPPGHCNYRRKPEFDKDYGKPDFSKTEPVPEKKDVAATLWNKIGQEGNIE